MAVQQVDAVERVHVLSPLKFVILLGAVGVAIGFLFARLAGEYTISLQDWEWHNVDDTTAMIIGGLIGAAAGLVWGVVRRPEIH
jgi:hypothetical protein